MIASFERHFERLAGEAGTSSRVAVLERIRGIIASIDSAAKLVSEGRETGVGRELARAEDRPRDP